MLERYFQMKLEDFGLPVENLNLSWNVGFCQGDFVSFTCSIDFDTMEKLLRKKLGIDIGPESETNSLGSDDFNSMMHVLRDFGSNDLAIVETNQTMYVESSDDFESVFDYAFQDIIAVYNDTIPWDVNRRWNQEWNSFLQWLQSEARSLCSKLLRDAHEILQAGITQDELVWSTSTDNFIVQLYETPAVDLNFDNYEEETRRDVYKSLVDGELRYHGLIAKVLDRQSQRLLGESCHLDFLTPSGPCNRSYDGRRSELVGEAIHEARALFERHSIHA